MIQPFALFSSPASGVKLKRLAKYLRVSVDRQMANSDHRALGNGILY